MIKSLRGMNDIIDNENFLYFIEVASNVAKNYGFKYIETPILEETALFKRSVGESSDIVNKEMYQFIDKGNNDVCLRPEGTAGVVRSFIEHKFDRIKGIKRFFYYGPMFRYERPQKGRLREFHQFGCESFGVESVYEDANLIILIHNILTKLNINYNLEINSLGCNNCMPKYKEDLVKNLTNIKDSLCSDCQKRIITNPIRVFDCKNSSCQEKLKDIDKITDSLCDSCNSDFKKLQQILKNNNIKFTINSNLVRGLDYYNKTAFEFTSTNLGAQNAIAGGGRYDKLVSFLGGKETPAVGFAIGIERILDLIEINKTTNNKIYLGSTIDNGLDIIFKLANKKRFNQEVFVDYKTRSFNKHLNNSLKQNFSFVAILTEENLQNNTIWTKNLITDEEKIITINEF